jgi:uncharacterized protein (TIGR02453 family)
LRFLRALKRNNDREWFRARRDRFEAVVRAPMIALVEQLARDFRAFAPELVAAPKPSLYRIYRDTRFGDNKTPLKTHIAAGFPWRGLRRHESAGLYLEVAAGWTWVGGGLWRPQPLQLHRVREHIAETYPEIDRLRRAAAFKRCLGSLEGDRLTRVPRGFNRDHPAAEYLKFTRFVAGREFPAEFAVSDAFYPTVVRTFRALMPIVRFLNEPLTGMRDPGSGIRRFPGFADSEIRDSRIRLGIDLRPPPFTPL